MTHCAWCEQLIDGPVRHRGVPYHRACFARRGAVLYASAETIRADLRDEGRCGRIHRSLRVTPAMEAGMSDHVCGAGLAN